MKSSDFSTDYVVKVKKAHGFTNYDTARLQISVGQPYHEGEKFIATLIWVASRFSKVIICVNDTLQRHNFCFEKGLPDAVAKQLAQTHGDQWLERHMPAIKAIMPNHEIHRWEEWRDRADYAGRLEKTKKDYQERQSVRDCINAIIMDFWKRRINKLGFTEDEKFIYFHKHSTQYFLEELTVFQMMFEQEEAADIYPGSALLPTTLAKKQFTRIGFARKDEAEERAVS